MRHLLAHSYRICTARQLAAIAASAGCPWDRGHPGFANAGALTWRFVEAFPVWAIHGRDDWERWYAGEKASADEGQDSPRSFAELERRLIAREGIEPIVLAESLDGRCYLWDGCHRTAAARLLGVEALPAIVGYRRRVVAEAAPACPASAAAGAAVAPPERAAA